MVDLRSACYCFTMPIPPKDKPKDDNWDDALGDRAQQTVSPDIVRKLLEMNPALRESGMTTNATVEHVQRAHQQAAKTPAPAAKKPASMGIVNQAPRAGSDGDIVSAFGEMKRRLGAENKRIDEEIARLKKSREDAATQTRDRVRQWLIEHDPDVRSPVTQSVLDQEKAFLQQVGFTVKGYVEERTKKAK